MPERSAELKKRLDHIAEDYICKEDYSTHRRYYDQRLILGLAYPFLILGHYEHTVKASEHTEDQNGPQAYISVYVAPVPYLCVIVPQPKAVQEIKAEPSGNEFDYSRAYDRDKEEDHGMDLTLIYKERQCQRTESVDRQPGAESLSALDEVALVDPVEEHLVYPSDDAAQKCQEKKRDDRSLTVRKTLAH